MKKSKLINIIRESIKSLMTEQGSNCGSNINWYDGSNWVSMQSGCHVFERVTSPTTCNGSTSYYISTHMPDILGGTNAMIAGIGSSEMFWQWLGSPFIGEVVSWDVVDESNPGNIYTRYAIYKGVQSGQNPAIPTTTQGYVQHHNPQKSGVDCLGNPGPQGCTDPQAINYDPSAAFDDGSCNYSVGIEPIDPSIDLKANMPAISALPKITKSCEYFYAATQQMQDNCCSKCANGSVTLPNDPCYILTDGCRCCDPITRGDDPCKDPEYSGEECFICREPGPLGCQSLAALNMTVASAAPYTVYNDINICNAAEECKPDDRRNDDPCVPVDGQMPSNWNEETECWYCKEPGSPSCQNAGANAPFICASHTCYNLIADCHSQSECGPSSGEMIECQCCDGMYPQSMVTPVPAIPGCSALNGGGLWNCQPQQSTPISCKKPLPTPTILPQIDENFVEKLKIRAGIIK